MKFISTFLLFFFLSHVLIGQQIKTVEPSGTYYAGQSITFEVSGITGTVNYEYGYAAQPYNWSQITPNSSSDSQFISGTGIITIPPPTGGQSTVICRLSNGNFAVAIYDPISAQPHFTIPGDFEDFWDGQYQSANTVVNQFTLTDETDVGDHKRYKFSIRTISSNHILAGFVFVPETSGTHPMMMRHFPAFTPASPNLYFGTPNNLIVVHCNFYNNADPTSTNGSVEAGTMDQNTFELRHVILGSIKLIDYFYSNNLDNRITFNQQDFGIFGNSRGGGMSMIVAGIDHLLSDVNPSRAKAVKVISVSAPAFTAQSNPSSRMTSYPHWVNSGQSSNASSAYYDAIHFSKYYTGTTFMETNYLDDVCPAEGNLAALNQSRGNAILSSNPLTGHSHGGAFWNYSIDEFLKQYLNNNLNVTSGNIGYHVVSGNDFSANINEINTLSAQVFQEGVDITSGLSNIQWNVIEPLGSNNVSFPNGNNSPNAQVQINANGNYVLRFSGTIEPDGQYADDDRENGFYTFIDYTTVTVGNSGSCTITALNANVVCDDQNTSDESDDSYGISVNPSGSNTGSQYKVLVDGIDRGLYNYGSIESIPGDYLISQGNIQVVIEDQADPFCTYSQTVQAPQPCSSGGCSGASEFTGCNVTVEVSGQDVRFVSTTETGILIIKVRRLDWSEQHDLCNDYNSATECSTSSVATVNGTGTYVVDVQGGTGCSTFNITVDGSGGGVDADNDNICANDDCDDNDPLVGAQQPPNTPCDDGNSNTTNDVILADGCTCQGSTTGCQIDVDDDGICANEDCDDNDSSVGASQPQYTPCDDGNSNTSFDMIQADGCTCLGTDCGSSATQFTGCNVTVEVDGQDVRFVSTTETGTLIIKVRRQDWSEQHDLCNDYNGATECSTSSVATVNGTGTYVVDIQGGTGCNTFNITVGGGSGGGTDADNDTVCDLIDCDDNDPSVGEPQPEGTPCDDGDSSTSNDVIQADGCTCQGTNTGCQIDMDDDGICANEDCNDNDASVGASQPQYTPCDDGNPNTSFDMIQADGCTCLGTDCGSGAIQFTGCNVTVEVSGQDVRFVSTTETGTLIIKIRRQDWSEQYDLCNDYNSTTECSASSVVTINGTGAYVVDIQGGTGCSTFNITVDGPGGGTDADNDSICDLIDCDDNDASVGEPQPENTPCDDDNSGTSNDVILADGCTCQGSSNLVSNTSNTTIHDLTVYPNPADNKIHIALNSFAGKKGTLEIFNQLGQRQFLKNYLAIPTSPIDIDLSEFNSGIYLISINIEDNYREVKQFVVIDRG